MDQKQYITNPFTLAKEGIKELYANANGIFWATFALGIFSMYDTIRSYAATFLPADKETKEQEAEVARQMENFTLEHWIAFGLFILLLVSTLFALAVIMWGMGGYTSSKLAKNEKPTLGEAFSASLSSFWRLVSIALIMGLRIIGWSLLLIIPGLVMAYRYALSPTVAFAEPDLKPGKVVTKSAKLTKGAWLDTFASLTLIPMLTLQLLGPATEVGAQARLYRQLTNLKKSGEQKPDTSFLSHFTLAIFILAILSTLLHLARSVEG